MNAIHVQKRVPLTAMNTFGLPVIAREFVEVADRETLREALFYAEQEGLEVLILGGGSNLVIMGDFPGLVIKISLKGVVIEGTRVKVAAGESWHSLVESTIARGLFGLENLSLIPGSAGAAPVQNIGAYGVELGALVESVELMDRETGVISVMTKDACRFGYRTSFFKEEGKGRYVILALTLQLSNTFEPVLSYASLRQRINSLKINENELTASRLSQIVMDIRNERLPDPRQRGNVGSFFKNPQLSITKIAELQKEFPMLPVTPQGGELRKVSAAWMIEQCGLKGESMGGASVSNQHALVLVNKGNARWEELDDLIQRIIESVDEKFGVLLETEPEIIRVDA